MGEFGWHLIGSWWVASLETISKGQSLCDHLGVSENSVPLNPMVLLIIIPIKWLFHWEYTLFSDKPIYQTSSVDTGVESGDWGSSSVHAHGFVQRLRNPMSCNKWWTGRGPNGLGPRHSRGHAHRKTSSICGTASYFLSAKDWLHSCTSTRNSSCWLSWQTKEPLDPKLKSRVPFSGGEYQRKETKTRAATWMTQVELLRNLIFSSRKRSSMNLCCKNDSFPCCFPSIPSFVRVSLQRSRGDVLWRHLPDTACSSGAPVEHQPLHLARALVIWPVHLGIYNVYIRMEVYPLAKKNIALQNPL